MGPKHAQELRELDEKGLCKMSLKGSGAHDVTVIVHKNVPNSIWSKAKEGQFFRIDKLVSFLIKL